MIGGHGLESGQRIDLSDLSLGGHTFSVDAVDNAGNSQSVTVHFSVAISPGPAIPALPSLGYLLLLALLLAGVAIRSARSPATRT